MPPSQLWAEASRVLPRWVCLLLVVAIGWQVAKTILLLFPAGEPAAPPPAPVLRQSTTEQPSVDVNRVVSAHLFGEPGAEALPPDETVDAPETQLSLQLRGTIAGTEGQKTLAIIAERGGEERVYEVGDAVPGGATLHQVRSDQVILRRAGRLEALKLPRSEELVGTRRTSAVPRSTSPAARVATVQEIVQQGGASLTEVIRPQPVFKDGRQQGYRVYPGRQRQQFAELGLRPGDLVTQINGMALDDPAEGMEIFRSLADATSVSVTVERNGQTEILTLDTSALQQAPPGDGNPTE
jgi:general secretion pathway protein C